MKNLKWWLIVVGAFYLILALTSCWMLFVNPQLFGEMFPFAADDVAIRAFADAWLIFVLEMGVLGIIMLFAARDPGRNRILVLTVAVLELIRGAGGDALWMARGWPPANYIPFMILHLIIAGMAFLFLRQTGVQSK